MVGGGIGRNIEDVPNVFGKRERRPLQRKAQPRRIRGQSNNDIAQSLSLGCMVNKSPSRRKVELRVSVPLQTRSTIPHPGQRSSGSPA